MSIFTFIDYSVVTWWRAHSPSLRHGLFPGVMPRSSKSRLEKAFSYAWQRILWSMANALLYTYLWWFWSKWEQLNWLVSTVHKSRGVNVAGWIWSGGQDGRISLTYASSLTYSSYMKKKNKKKNNLIERIPWCVGNISSWLSNGIVIHMDGFCRRRRRCAFDHFDRFGWKIIMLFICYSINGIDYYFCLFLFF